VSQYGSLSPIFEGDTPPLKRTPFVGIQSVIESRRSNRVSKVFGARARVIKETVIPL
jgi:hypothetical protein